MVAPVVVLAPAVVSWAVEVVRNVVVGAGVDAEMVGATVGAAEVKAAVGAGLVSELFVVVSVLDDGPCSVQYGRGSH